MLEGDGRDKCMPLGEEKIFDPSVRNLSNLNLGGEISPAIGDLKNLQSMDFQGNKLTGQIPDEIGNCVSLMLVPALKCLATTISNFPALQLLEKTRAETKCQFF